MTRYYWWRHAPPLARRFYTTMFLTLVAVDVGLLVLIISNWTPKDYRLGVMMFVLFTLGAVAWVLTVGLWEKRMMKRLDEASYRLCPKCGYNLNGLSGQVHCPECGREYTVSRAEAMWREFRPMIGG